MASEEPIHSMSKGDRALALRVLGAAWQCLEPPFGEAAIPDAVEQAVRAMHAADPDFDPEYLHFAGEAAVWYLDRAVRRIADADRNGFTAERRRQNLMWFGGTAGPEDVERLFAMASALDADDA